MSGVLLSGCPNWPGDKSARRQFELCVDDVKKEDCKNLLRFSVLKDVASRLPEEDHYGSFTNRSWFDVSLPADERMLSSRRDKKYEIHVRTFYATSEQELQRWLGNDWHYKFPVNQEIGNIFTIAESMQGDAGISISIPKSKNKSIYFLCTKPFRAIAGNLVTGTGCSVHAELSRYVFIEYPIYFEHLQKWGSIHNRVVQQLASVLIITYVPQGN